MKKYSLLFVLFLLAAIPLWAADHYVSTTGSATWANSTNISTPCSLATAFANASAGDIVYQRAGTYTLTPRIVPAGSGSSGSPITFTRYESEAVTWTTSVSSLEAIQLNHPYWTFSYMTWLDTHTGNTSSGDKAILKLGENGAATHVTLDHITATSSGTGDNYGILHVKGSSDYLTVTNCNFTVASGGSANTSCICTIRIDYMTIDHNIFYGPQSTLYFKHASTDETHNVLTNNYIYQTTSGRYTVFINGNGWTITNNIIRAASSTGQALRFGDSNGGITNPMTGNVIRHNTIYGRFWGYDSSGNLFQYNTLEYNIITGRQVYNPNTDTNSYTTMDYNAVQNSSSSMCDTSESTGYSLSGWQSKYNGVYECTNCTDNTVSFTGGNPPSTIAGYALATGSAGKGACPDLSDMGADVSLVGPDVVVVDTPPICTITSPTSASTYNNGTDSTFDCGGTVTPGTAAVSYVTWSNDKGGSGTCTGTTTWTQTNIDLQNGTNRIIVTAYDVNGLTHSDYIDVSYAPADTTAPVCTITSPTSSATYDAGSAATINLGGTATDAVGVTDNIAWSNDRGGSGTATCTGCTGTSVTWTITGITIYDGANVITVTAYDAANNPGTDTITVTTDIEPPPNHAPDTPYVTSVEADDSTLTTGSTVIFKDDLANFTSYYDLTAFVIDTGVGHGGSTNSARATWTSGQTDIGNFMLILGRSPVGQSLRGTEDFTDIYVRQYVLMDSVTQNLCKIGRASVFANVGCSWFCAQAAVGHVWGILGTTTLQLDPCSGVSGSSVVTTGWNDTSNFTWLGAQYGGTSLYSSTYDDRWFCIEYHMKLNTPGSSDGILEEWIDGVLDAQVTGLNFRGSYASYGINSINFEASMNSPGADSTKHKWIDHIVVSTQPIGLALSPVNPTIYKSAFSDADLGNTQSALNAQVSTSASVTNLVWDGTVNSSANSIVVNTTNGTFSGSLAGKPQLSGTTQYYARTRVSDGTDYSSWSSWYPLKTVTSEQITPSASFYAIPLTSTPSLAVSFYDTSSGTPTSWIWDIDNDGDTDYTTQNPTHTYNTPGTYSVRLMATNAQGYDEEIKTDYITVYATTVIGGKITGGKTQ